MRVAQVMRAKGQALMKHQCNYLALNPALAGEERKLA